MAVADTPMDRDAKFTQRATIVLLVVVAVALLPTVGSLAQTNNDDGPLPEVAFLADAHNFPDALAASAVAGVLGAPVLLTPGTGLGDSASQSLQALQPDLVVLSGGTAALSHQVRADVEALGFHVERVSGPTRTETAAALADFAVDLGAGRPVVTGREVQAGTIPGLDSETLQGMEPDAFLGADETAVDSETLQGMEPDAFLGADETAVDSEALQGLGPDAFMPADSDVVGGVRVFAAARIHADADLRAAVGPIDAVERLSTGEYRVTFTEDFRPGVIGADPVFAQVSAIHIDGNTCSWRFDGGSTDSLRTVCNEPEGDLADTPHALVVFTAADADVDASGVPDADGVETGEVEDG